MVFHAYVFKKFTVEVLTNCPNLFQNRYTDFAPDFPNTYRQTEKEEIFFQTGFLLKPQIRYRRLMAVCTEQREPGRQMAIKE